MTPHPLRSARIALAATLLAACTDAPDALEPATDGTDVRPAYTATAAGQTDGILDLIAAQDAAWTAKDAAAYADTYTEDTELINPVGGFLVGRDVVRTQHAFLFNPVNGFFRESTSSWTLRSLTFLTGRTALVKLDVALTGFSGLPPGLPQTEPGVVRTRVTWVAVKQGPQWLILHQQMTPVMPAP